MKWIKTLDLRQWADSLDCQQTLPLLIRKLIRATSNNIRNIHFPSGENILIGGWDGLLEAITETTYIPEGISLWEFGTNKDIKGKADTDYKKRTNDPLGYNHAEATYIFVTARLWNNKDSWIKEKKEENIWKDVQVIDASYLEEWIETAPTVGAWLARHLGKYPSEGIRSTEDFWEEWVSGNKFDLNEKILLGGRNEQQQLLINSINSPAIIPIQGISREEALAFIISSFKSNAPNEEDFFSRSIIVDNQDSFRALSINNQPLILIPRLDDNGIINRALKNGHTILIPLGVDSSANWEEKVNLPRIDRDSFISALGEVGIVRELAEQYSKESARDITILRRKLGFDHTTPSWAAQENVSDIIPALLAGRWDENREGDKDIISALSNDTYENYISKLSRWLLTDDSPIIKIGSKWRLTSPFDSWTNASKYITNVDFETLRESFNLVLSEINPAFELSPEKRYAAGLYGKNKKYSSWLREGITQSLILTSVFGKKLILNLPMDSNQWVSLIINNFLKTTDLLLWKSIDSILPLIAEASPDSFLSAIDKHLKEQESPIISLFDEDPGMLTPHSYHTGLLWALEELAWFPEYLSRAVLLLGQLATRDPGGGISNRPINSLLGIFKPWYYQTFAPFEERTQVLELLMKRNPEVSWDLLKKMLPNPRDTAHPTHMMRWRMFELENRPAVTNKEVYNTYSFVIDKLLELVGNSEDKIAELIAVADNMSSLDREKIFTYIDNNYHKIVYTNHKIWHACRETLHHHRTYPEQDWSLPEGELIRYQQLYDRLVPDNNLENIVWLFEEHFPAFSEGAHYESENHEAYEDLILQKRIEVVKSVYNESGIYKLIEIIPRIKEVWIFGNTVSHVVDSDADIINICGLLSGNNDCQIFSKSFIANKLFLKGFEWSINLYQNLGKIKFENEIFINYLTSSTPERKLWDFIESLDKAIIDGYWRLAFIHPRNQEDRISGSKKLIQYNRFFSAIHIVYLYRKEMPSDLIIELLQKAGTIKVEEEGHFDIYKVNALFEELDNRKGINNTVAAQLEWLYLSVLTSYSNRRKPERLYNELSKNPTFFIDLVKIAFRSDMDKEEDSESIDESGIIDEQKQHRARAAFDLLYSWKKIPGVEKGGTFDPIYLNEWINTVREMAKSCKRVKATDIIIGRVLAHYPERKNLGSPPDEICTIIESLNSEVLNRNFSSEIFNGKEVTVRKVFEGGNIERNKASFFFKVSENLRNKYPLVASLFENTGKDYEAFAKKMDEDAERSSLDY